MHITKLWNTNGDARTSNSTIHNILTLEWRCRHLSPYIFRGLIGILPIISRDPPGLALYCKSNRSVCCQ